QHIVVGRGDVQPRAIREPHVLPDVPARRLAHRHGGLPPLEELEPHALSHHAPPPYVVPSLLAPRAASTCATAAWSSGLRAGGLAWRSAITAALLARRRSRSTGPSSSCGWKRSRSPASAKLTPRARSVKRRWAGVTPRPSSRGRSGGGVTRVTRGDAVFQNSP